MDELDIAASQVEESDIAVSPMDESDITVSPMDESDITVSPMEQSDIAVSPMDKLDIDTSPMDKSNIGASPVEDGSKSAEDGFKHARSVNKDWHWQKSKFLWLFQGWVEMKTAEIEDVDDYFENNGTYHDEKYVLQIQVNKVAS